MLRSSASWRERSSRATRVRESREFLRPPSKARSPKSPRRSKWYRGAQGRTYSFISVPRTSRLSPPRFGMRDSDQLTLHHGEYWYALLAVSPQPETLEAANVGVVFGNGRTFALRFIP